MPFQDNFEPTELIPTSTTYEVEHSVHSGHKFLLTSINLAAAESRTLLEPLASGGAMAMQLY